MADVLVSTETFNEYADNIALDAVWGNGILAQGAGVTKDAAADGSQYIALGIDSGAGDPAAWGHAPNKTTRAAFTGLTPGGTYRIRFKMSIGHSASSTIGGFPAPHSFTAGLQANADRYLVAVVDQHAPEGERNAAGIPVDAVLYEYPALDISGAQVGTKFAAINGWKDYSLLTTADGSGHITIVIGVFDDRYFSANVYFDDITIWLVPPPPPPTVTGPNPAGVRARGGSCYLDSFLEYDGRNVGTDDGLFPSVTVTLSGGTTWAVGETLTLTALGIVFVSGDVGNVLILHGADGTKVRFTITGFTSGTVVTGVANVAIPSGMRSVELAVWDKAVDQVAGLEHLEQEYVGIFADDHVVGSPNNARITLRQVVDGVVDLGDFYTHVFVGLPYLSDLETLDIDRPQGPSMKANNIDITRVGLMLLQSRPAWCGSEPPSDDSVDPLENLDELPLPTDDEYETLVTGYRDVNIKSEWNSNGRVFVRSVDPTPFTVLAAIPQGFLPG